MLSERLKKINTKIFLKGIFKGCKISNCYLSGGETAEMPGIYDNNKFDLAGFSVGLVDKKKILNGKKIKNENLILAVPSSGLHSNGFSLVRYILKTKRINNRKFLNKPNTYKIYVNEVLKLHAKKFN